MSAWRFRPLGPVGLISFLVGLIVRCVRVLHDLPCSLNLALALVDQVSGTRQRVADVLELLCTSGAVLGLTFIIGHRYHPGLALRACPGASESTLRWRGPALVRNGAGLA